MVVVATVVVVAAAVVVVAAVVVAAAVVGAAVVLRSLMSVCSSFCRSCCVGLGGVGFCRVYKGHAGHKIICRGPLIFAVFKVTGLTKILPFSPHRSQSQSQSWSMIEQTALAPFPAVEKCAGHRCLNKDTRATNNQLY